MLHPNINVVNFVSKLNAIYNVMRNWLCVICTIAAIAVGFWALYTPPQGVIDPSVLWFTAQLLIFTASLLGIKLDLPFKDGIQRAIGKSDKGV